jgi:hypothetical protein
MFQGGKCVGLQYIFKGSLTEFECNWIIQYYHKNPGIKFHELAKIANKELQLRPKVTAHKVSTLIKHGSTIHAGMKSTNSTSVYPDVC